MRYLKTMFTAFVLTICLSLNAFAGNLSDLDIINYDQADAEILAGIENGIKDIPEEILRYHNYIGGSVTFIPSRLPGQEDNVAGLFYYSGPIENDIYVRVDTAFYDDNQNLPDVVLAHEIGHFIYKEWENNMSEDQKAGMNQLHDYWSKHRLDCYSIDETFAVLYSNAKLRPEKYDDKTNGLLRSAEEHVIAIAKANGITKEGDLLDR